MAEYNHLAKQPPAAKWRDLCELIDMPQDTEPEVIAELIGELRWSYPQAV